MVFVDRGQRYRLSPSSSSRALSLRPPAYATDDRWGPPWLRSPPTATGNQDRSCPSSHHRSRLSAWLCDHVLPSLSCRRSKRRYSPSTSLSPTSCSPQKSPPVASNRQYSDTPVSAYRSRFPPRSASALLAEPISRTKSGDLPPPTALRRVYHSATSARADDAS